MADLPNLIPDVSGIDAGSEAALRASVAYLGGMTDRLAGHQGVTLLSWDPERLPKGVDTFT